MAEPAETPGAGLSEDDEDRFENHVRILRDWSQAYPEDVFLPIPEELRAKDAIAADLLRSVACPQFARDADAIEELLDRCRRLEERGRQMEEAQEAAAAWIDSPNGVAKAYRTADLLSAALAAPSETEPAEEER